MKANNDQIMFSKEYISDSSVTLEEEKRKRLSPSDVIDKKEMMELYPKAKPYAVIIRSKVIHNESE